MGWRDDPVVQPGAWRNDPIVPAAEPTMMDRARELGKQASQFAAGQLTKMKQAYEGKHDPRYRDVPEYSAEGVAPTAKQEIERGEMFAQSDEALAGVMKKQLGDQFVGVRRDENGYPLIRYRSNVDGSEKEVYVNKPGGSQGDLRRFLMSSLPYMATGSLAERVVRGRGPLGAAMKVGTQVLGGAATSLGEDVAAGRMGSEEAPSASRAVGAGAGAGVGQAGGAVLSALARQFKQYGLFRGGQLTPRGVALAQKYGVDPEALTAEAGKIFSREVAQGAHPKAAANKARVESRGLRGTTGDYTEDAEQLLLERDLRKGRMGPDAAREMVDREAAQTKELEHSVDKYSAEEFGHGVDTAAASGQELQSGVRSKFAERKAKVDEAFDNFDMQPPTAEDKAALSAHMKTIQQTDPDLFKELSSFDPSTNPNTTKALRDISKWTSEKGLKTSGRRILGAEPQDLDVEQLRKRLTSYREAAAASDSGGDLRLVSRVMDQYNKHLIESYAQSGDPNIKKFLRAISMHKELMNAFGTRGDPSRDPGGKFMQDLIYKDTTPEGIVDRVLGAGKKAPRDSVAVLKRLKETMGEDSPEWALLKATAMYKMTTGGGKSLPADKMVSQATDLMQNNSIYRELFSPEELNSLNRYFDDIRIIQSKDVPAGVKSRELSELERVRQEGFLKFYFRKMGTRETFRGRPFNSMLWNILAKSKLVTPIFNLEKAGAVNLARKAASGQLPRRPARTGGYVGAGARGGAAYEELD